MMAGVLAFAPPTGCASEPAAVWAPSARSPADSVLNNPMRGYFNWLGRGLVPLARPASECYFRVTWAELEHGENDYDFVPIEKGLAQLKPGGRIAFGVESMSTASRTGIAVPNYIVTKLAKGFYAPRRRGAPKRFYVPDWNNPYFLRRVECLFKTLGAKYDGDPRIEFVDIRMYGNYGEFHDSGDHAPVPYDDRAINLAGCRPGTVETRRTIINAQVKAFPRTRLVMMTDDTDSLIYALKLKTRIPIGMRRDSWGWTHFEKDLFREPVAPADKEMILNRWKVAPFVVEPAPAVNGKRFEAGLAALSRQVLDYHISQIGNYNFVSDGWKKFAPDEQRAMIGAGNLAGYNLWPQRIEYAPAAKRGMPFRVSSQWLNIGAAPVYENWLVKLSLVDHAGASACSFLSRVDLRTLMPAESPAIFTDTFMLPKAIKAGLYSLRLQVTAPSGCLGPMVFPIQETQTPSGYTLGKVEILNED
jgi:hypothetical protein